MFTFSDQPRGQSRRDFLKVGSLALGGLTLPGLLSARAATPAKAVTGKSVIYLFMHGGPSQFETFDPKMSAPANIRSTTGEVQTSIPGITFGGTFERLAKMADKLAIIRSYRPGDANHDIKPIVHKDFLNANLGSIYARVAGMNHPVTGMPTNAALFPKAVDTSCQKETTSFGNWASTGLVGSSFAPFVPGGEGLLLQNMRMKLAQDRLDDRRSLLTQLDNVRRQIDASGSMDTVDRFQGQAFDVLARNKVLAQPAKDVLEKIVKADDWNEYTIRCEGPRVRLWLNGTLTVDWVEKDDKIERTGIIGLQVHGGGKTKVLYKDIVIEELVAP